MNGKYNLNERAGADSFEFVLDDIKYHMQYPTSRDVLQLNDVINESEDWQIKVEEITQKLESAEPSEKKELQTQLEDYTSKAKIAQETFIDWCAKYISSQDTKAPNIKDTLLNKNVKYMLAFVDMVKTELSS